VCEYLTDQATNQQPTNNQPRRRRHRGWLVGCICWFVVGGWLVDCGW